jgi:hypothetical protein
MKMSKWVVSGVVVMVAYAEFQSHPFDQPHIHADVGMTDTVIDCSVPMSASATASAIPSYVAPNWYPPWK